jgi:hypothetical protein
MNLTSKVRVVCAVRGSYYFSCELQGITYHALRITFRGFSFQKEAVL